MPAWSDQQLAEWMEQLSAAQSAIRLAPDCHTLREICQQPLSWPLSATAATRIADSLAEWEPHAIVLTGSGSSLYAAECVAPALQESSGLPVQAIAGGDLITEGARAFSPLRPCVVIWFARSGNSPESYGALELLLKREPGCRHLVLTTNSEGRLAKAGSADARVSVIPLDPRTCDQSLVMTSSFTNMVVAAQTVAFGDRTKLLSRIASHVLLHYSDVIADTARGSFRSAIFLGSGCRFGSAREASLKLQEMTGGSVPTFAETFLGLRHGPMSSVHRDTLLVCLLSSQPVRRAYELDLIHEVDRKSLGATKLIVGENIPADVVSTGDVAIECQGLGEAGDDAVTVIDAVAGQLLAFFRCIAEGLNPDQPSRTGAISRVVETFTLH